jgi:putative flavoprotein involved in K+ transport
MSDQHLHATPDRTAELVEPGDAFTRLEQRRLAAAGTGHYDVIVIGGGQAGLVAGYHLQRAGVRFLILDAGERIGDSWRQRWDSLRLFTPARYDALSGMKFPSPQWYFPTKNEMASYLEAYAAKFALPVRLRSRVERLSKKDNVFVLQGEDFTLRADQVVVAMSSYQRPRAPAFARELRSDIVQLHSLDYRKPAQLGPGGVLVVGAGNSGAEIGLELARSHSVWLSGRDVGNVPFDIRGTASRLFLARLLIGFVFHHVITVTSPIGRRIRPRFISRGAPLIRIRPGEVEAAGVKRVGRVIGARDGLPLLDDGSVLDVRNVIFSTGFHHGLDWIDLPIVGPDGEPRHRSGISTTHPGLYFVGQHFLHSFSSTMIRGVSRDAERVVRAAIAARGVAKSRREAAQRSPHRGATMR